MTGKEYVVEQINEIERANKISNSSISDLNVSIMKEQEAINSREETLNALKVELELLGGV